MGILRKLFSETAQPSSGWTSTATDRLPPNLPGIPRGVTKSAPNAKVLPVAATRPRPGFPVAHRCPTRGRS